MDKNSPKPSIGARDSSCAKPSGAQGIKRDFALHREWRIKKLMLTVSCNVN